MQNLFLLMTQQNNALETLKALADLVKCGFGSFMDSSTLKLLARN
jgi:hypothetical protein